MIKVHISYDLITLDTSVLQISEKLYESNWELYLERTENIGKKNAYLCCPIFYPTELVAFSPFKPLCILLSFSSFYLHLKLQPLYFPWSSPDLNYSLPFTVPC
jgi:hypothetical protein